MALVTAILFAAVLRQADLPYSPASHRDWIAGKLKMLRVEIAHVEDDHKPIGPVLGRLGKTLSEARRWQSQLGSYLKTADAKHATEAISAVQLAGMFDAYVSSAIFSLDDDADARELRTVLERRIFKLLAKK